MCLSQVTFVHDGCDYVLGLFNTLDEAHRVCDVLNSEWQRPAAL